LANIQPVLDFPTGEYMYGLYGNGDAANEIAKRIIAFLSKA
jgi:hypothetical protein